MHILDHLLACESRMSAGSGPRKNRFIRYKTWYANKDYMRKIISYPVVSAKDRIPGLHKTVALGLTANFLRRANTCELLPSSADVFEYRHAGDCVRAFYATSHGHPYTLKIICDSDRRKFVEAVKREVALREHLASLKTINIPKILGAEQRGDAFILSEELILGRRFSPSGDRMLYRTSLLPQLRDTYRAYGVRYVPIGTLLRPELVDKVKRLVSDLAGGKRFAEALEALIERNGLVAVSLCHGSLAPSSLAVANGTVIFLDWKRSNKGLIIVDLLKTIMKYPNQPYMFREMREMIVSNFIDPSCPFEDLFAAGLALRLLHQRRGSIPRLLRVWRRHALSRPAK